MDDVNRLTPKHRQLIRLLVAGLPLLEASQCVGLSMSWCSKVYCSQVGQEFAHMLEDKANDYAACLMALGLVPSNVGCNPRGGKHPKVLKEVKSKSSPSKQ